MANQLLQPAQRWFIKRLPEDQGEVRLTQKRIYILPTRAGILLAGLIFTMLIGSLNYGTSLGFVMTFLLVGIGLVCVMHTFRNLHQLNVAAYAGDPVFAGERAHFKIVLHNTQTRSYYAISVNNDHSNTDVIEAVEPEHYAEAVLQIPTHKRGRLGLEPVRIQTSYPLGLLRSWTWLKPTCECLVYPTPAETDMPLPNLVGQGSDGKTPSLDKEDFAGFRHYQAGDPLKQVAWRTLAKGQPLMTKEFTGESGNDLWLSWNTTAENDIEKRLSRLCRWVLDAQANGLRYGLDIPGARIEPASGRDHQNSCLEALANFG